ncbi:F-box/FBD/LRR-repeat protein At1g13570-like [Vicia villosa]|uniref:F-box/FBD/LRR-repeat protein At1g13570-like n=1 Tax=Vicia villosa TaxID=3911 RepID=UPI00273B6ABF|nr:F-box/FBD/LRR-repeat protein At1g13570-like [Vicia villosa]XP_058745798.1 F-box/FBD/LRR-repeat protein At1g13570-like [Vicia villosa]XP_058752555.1 F-box/FBD/LRR-repeat protein At1g13570-like [Vicia villosa]XP_058752556.1 F-box/FBD/LRR-repeat protein At1g13570-like [Vicia villosa]
MSQPNKKANYGDPISDLPGNVIDCILQHLFVKDLIRTSILSTKWRYMWTSVPRLKFNDEFYCMFDNLNDPASEFSRIITEILFLHNGPILEFILQVPWASDSKDKITYEYLNKWILFLSRKGLKHIKLTSDERDLVQVPSHLFSCRGLTYLQLDTCNLSIPSSFYGFKTLLHLCLEFMTFELGALETLLSGCPLLEKLDIEYCSGCECIDLSSSSALIDLTLSLPQKCAFGLNKIQRLTLVLLRKTLLCTDVFPLSQLITSLKYLRLDEVNLDEREELLYIVSVLKNASNLVELHIVTYEANDYKVQVPAPSEKLEFSGCCLSELQKVNIRVGTSTKHAMSLARFILATSLALKTLTFDFRFCMKPDASILLSISQDLLWMERASQRAHVEFIHQ